MILMILAIVELEIQFKQIKLPPLTCINVINKLSYLFLSVIIEFLMYFLPLAIRSVN